MNPLFLKYLNSVKLFEAPNDQGKPEIKVESVDNRKENANKDVVNKDEDEKKEEQKEQDRETKAFQKTADDLIKAANKVDKDFEKKINEVAVETDTKMPKYMVEILNDLDHKNGHEILAMLANDEDLYQEICELSERRMTKRLDKMSEELKNKNKTPRQRERIIPDPIEPINDG